tara:strand:+ start:437 stop:1789 length:1353 start_codon:yes stop_codon:yes gene_type:complete
LSIKLIFFINIIIAFLLTSITIKFKIYNFFIITSFVTILVNTIYSSSILYEKYTNQNKNFNNDSFLVSKKLNIFVISFDNIPYHIIEDEFKKDKNKSYLSDFVFFNKFISASHATQSNIIFEMYGNKLQNNSKKTVSEYINELKPNPNNLFNFINKKNINKNIYGSYNYILQKDQLLDFKDIELFERITLSFERFIVPSLERLFTYKLTLFYNNHIRNKYHWNNKQSLMQFKKFTKNINNSGYTEDVIFNIGHWTFTKPIVLNENCQIVQNIPQVVSQMINVGKCSMKLFEKFINILKNKGIYKNSIIIFKSDTGLHSSYYPKSEKFSLSKNNSIYGYSMYRPFLMVKPLNSNKLDKINESIITTFDLANYYCNEIKKFIIDKSKRNSCKSLGNKALYEALYLNKIKSNREINILFDDGTSSHSMKDAIFKTINIIGGNVDEAFLKVFTD